MEGIAVRWVLCARRGKLSGPDTFVQGALKSRWSMAQSVDVSQQKGDERRRCASKRSMILSIFIDDMVDLYRQLVDLYRQLSIKIDGIDESTR